MLKRDSCTYCDEMDKLLVRRERTIEHKSKIIREQEDRHRREFARLRREYQRHINELENVVSLDKGYKSSRDSLQSLVDDLTGELNRLRAENDAAAQGRLKTRCAELEAELASTRRQSPLWWLKGLAQICTGKTW